MTDKQTTKTEGQHTTAVWRNGGFSASYDSFMLGSSAVLRLNFCTKIRHYAKPQNVVCYALTDHQKLIDLFLQDKNQ